MSAFYIFDNRETSNYDAVAEYIQKAPATVAAFGGKYRVIYGKKKVVEGDWQPIDLVIIEFPSYEKGEAWYNSDMYKPLKELRLGGSKGTGVLVEGLPPMPLFVRLFGRWLPARKPPAN